MTYFFRILATISVFWCLNPVVCSETPPQESLQTDLPPEGSRWIAQPHVAIIPALTNTLLGAFCLGTFENMCDQPRESYTPETIRAVFFMSSLLLAWFPSVLASGGFENNTSSLRNMYFGLILFTTLQLSLLMACG